MHICLQPRNKNLQNLVIFSEEIDGFVCEQE